MLSLLYLNFKYCFENLNVKFKSEFFDLEEELSLVPYEKREFDIQVEKEEFNKLMAGFYTLTAEIKTKGLESDVEGKIEFVEKDLLKTEKKDYGLIISTKVIEKDFVSMSSMKEWILEEDIGKMCSFLISEDSSKVSGQVISVDGHTERND